MFGDTYGWSGEYNFTAAPYTGTNSTIRVIAFGGKTKVKPTYLPNDVGHCQAINIFFYTL